jgi:hypothetical protein
MCTKREAQIINGGGKFLLNSTVKHEIEIHTTEHPTARSNFKIMVKILPTLP